ncbi:MAG: cheA, partial [Rhodospirillales bacterium]|nr:cheA [Rhodospirillales bacterium]
DLLREFLTETGESVALLDVELVRLEREPNDPGLLSSIFRLVHTIKGTCGFLGLPRLESVAHAGENVLGKFRDRELVVTPPAVTLILQSLDRIKSILSALEETGTEPAGDDSDLIARLHAAEHGDFGGGASSAEVLEEIAAAVTQAAEDDEPETVHPVPATQRAAALPMASPPNSDGAPAKESAVASQSIRVGVDLLESLMTTVSELVLTRNQLLQILRQQKETEFTGPLQRLNQVVSELQEGVMKTRMQPIGNAWGKLPRIVRDLAQELNKKIELEMRGAETELDRQVLELIKDPLTHMVRNSADHGIEKPSERVNNGKNDTGRIVLNAYHQGGYIIVEIADDGKGLPIDKIKAKVLKNGLATEAELAQLSDTQIQQYIFRAGFSTADAVTSVSGRGVGMDVVKTNIEKIGGTIELKSVYGQGSTFTIKIPLTLAIVSALIVESAGERYAIPQLSVIELVRASERAAEGEHRIERIKGAAVLRLRDRLLPLVSLQEILLLEPTASDDAERFIVVSQVGNYAFGIIVDRVFDTEEIVVKPVAPLLRHISMFSGNTILGDGSVIMILDPNGIAQATGEMIASERNAMAKQEQDLGGGLDETTALLVFRAGGGGPKAVPLSLISRLEEFDLADIEMARGQHVIQYRGKLMPLIRFDSSAPLGSTGHSPALVFADKDRAMGLLVEEIVDIVDEQVEIQLQSDLPGIIGSAVVAGKATDMVDAGFWLTQAFRDWFGSVDKYMEAGAGGGTGRRILLVDDSPFFRNLLTPMLQVAGYHVTTVDSAFAALELVERGERFDVIVSDIEMPGMSGFEFASRIKSDERVRMTPVLALSSHASPADLDRGRAAGFDDYVAKLDRDALLAALSEILSEHALDRGFVSSPRESMVKQNESSRAAELEMGSAA